MISDNELIAEFMGLYTHNTFLQDYRFYSSDPDGGGVGFAKRVKVWSKHEALVMEACDALDHHDQADVVNTSKTPIIKELQYHTSWDWLMPVVEKIENIRHIGIDAVYLQIKGRQCQIWTYFDVKEFLRLTGDDKNDGNKFKVGHSAKTKIEATYHACIDFIKWHNQQK